MRGIYIIGIRFVIAKGDIIYKQRNISYDYFTDNTRTERRSLETLAVLQSFTSTKLWLCPNFLSSFTGWCYTDVLIYQHIFKEIEAIPV